MKKNILLLSGCIILCQMAGIIGTFFTVSAIPPWYSTLNKPIFNPPPWLFGPVWGLLYTLMAISLFLVWKNKTGKIKKRKALTLFFIQLFLNAIWSPIFFGLHSPFFGFIVIILLWLSILLSILQFYQISKAATFLLVPYIFWVSFAALLNFFIWRLNI